MTASSGSTAISPTAKLHPAPTIALRVHVGGIPFVALMLLDADGKPLILPESVKPSVGTRVADALLVCDEAGNLELPKIRALPTTLALLPPDGSADGARSLPAAASGARIDVTLRDLQDGLVIPLDLPGAREKSLDAFDLSIEPAVEHVHRCC